MTAYYNEIDPYAAQWLRNLIAAKLIAPGVVDERSILDVRADDVRGYTQAHFFAGIGGWSYALRLAGWPDDRPAWTGSCPCQPLSSAGQRKGHADERHLWPAFHDLIAECRPSVVFGEQVASADGREWLSGVRADLEAVGYACGAADLCAAGVGAPHIRQRLYWLAHAQCSERWPLDSPCRDDRSNGHAQGSESPSGAGGGIEDGVPSRLANSAGERLEGAEQQRVWLGIGTRSSSSSSSSQADRVADPTSGHASPEGLQRGWEHGQWPQDGRCLEGLGDPSGAGSQEQRREYRPSGERCRGLVGFAVQDGVPQWNGPTVAVECSDGWRRVSAQPDAFPLAHGVRARMGKLRGAGNAINPKVGARFVSAFMDIEA